MSLDQAHLIPPELRKIPQWGCAAGNKRPINPRNGNPASVSDPSTWSDFELAERAARTYGFPHVGFFLSPRDPYTIIDLDDKPEKPLDERQKAIHQQIYDVFLSFTERSCGGRGHHIIVRGSLPSGVHSRDGVEVYSDARFMICTGNVERDLPIRDYQELLVKLCSEIKGTTPAPAELVDRESRLDDKDLVDMASKAENADKFNQLCKGEWKELGYPSQSEADFALLAMLAFYSPDNEQVRRVFRMTALGKREKATRNNDYLNLSLGKLRANEPPPIDASALLANQSASGVGVPEVRPTPPTPSTTSPANEEQYDLPPGPLGDLALYLYQNAIRPMHEAALAAALGFGACIVGRQYNTCTGAGLNDYFLLIAPTGTGKEAGRDGIGKIVQAVRPQVPMIDQFIGPGVFASGQSIPRLFEKKPSFVSFQGEIGHTIKVITRDNAHGWEVLHLRMLLDVWSRSGKGKMLGEIVYASQEKNVKDVESPALTIVGDSTPEVFFESMDDSSVTSGLLPRFNVVESRSDRAPLNKAANCEPPKKLVDDVATTTAIVLRMQNENTYIPVPLDADAQGLLDTFNDEADAAIRGSSDVHRQIWNRGHLHALKLATNLAVWDAPHSPIVKKVHAGWAIKFVRRSVCTLLSRFEKGEVGGGSQSKAEARVQQEIDRFLRMPPQERARDEKIPPSMRAGLFIPHAFLREHTRRVQPFKNDEHALKNVLEAMVKDGALRKLEKAEINKRFPGNRGGEVFEAIK